MNSEWLLHMKFERTLENEINNFYNPNVGGCIGQRQTSLRVCKQSMNKGQLFFAVPALTSLVNITSVLANMDPIFIFGYGSKLKHQGTAGCCPCFHLPGFHFGVTLFFTHSHVLSLLTCASEILDPDESCCTFVEHWHPRLKFARLRLVAEPQPPRSAQDQNRPTVVSWTWSPKMMAFGFPL